ncbi:MAG: PfkB domain-containing protein [Bacteroidetes bacterium]|nr:PfkB domain-containing protein [Bacteroidota bacterium]
MNRPKPDKPLDVVVAGLAVVDIIGKPIDLEHPPKKGGLRQIEDIVLTTGGNVSNVGIDLSKLGFRVGAITRVGEDGFAQVLMRAYVSHGVDVSSVKVDRDAQTSATMISVDRSGERTFLHTRGCMANFRASDILSQLNLIRKAKFLVFGYLGLIPEMERELPRLFRTVKERTGVKILLDTGGLPHRFGKKELRSFLSWVDYFIPSFKEAVALTGQKTVESIVDFLFDAGVRTMVGVKLAAKGCYIATREKAVYLRAKKIKKVVDTTGAGDAFVAGFVAGMLRGFDPFQAARIGNATAASCVTAMGASTAIRRLEHYL